MATWARDNILTLILAGVAGLLLIAVAIESAALKSKQMSVTASSEKAAAPEPTKAIDTEHFELPDIQEYETIVQRPLFMEGRRPGVEGDQPTATAAADTPLTVKLMGIAFTPTDKTALLVDAKGKYKRLKKNGTIEGWTLVDFAPDKVMLQRDDEQRELLLLKPKPKSAPVQGAHGQPQQAPQRQQAPPNPTPPPQPAIQRPGPPVEEADGDPEAVEEETVEEETEDVE